MLVVGLGQARLPFGGIDQGVERAIVGREANDIAVPQPTDRPAAQRFGREMDRRRHLAGCAGHAAVCDERDDASVLHLQSHQPTNGSGTRGTAPGNDQHGPRGVWGLYRFAHGQVVILAHQGNEGRTGSSYTWLEGTDPGRKDASPFGRIRCKRRGKPIGKLMHSELPCKTSYLLHL